MSKETRARKAMKKFSVGDGLSDDELDMMLDFFSDAEETLGELMVFNKSYGFAYHDVCRNHELLKVYKRHRDS